VGVPSLSSALASSIAASTKTITFAHQVSGSVSQTILSFYNHARFYSFEYRSSDINRFTSLVTRISPLKSIDPRKSSHILWTNLPPFPQGAVLSDPLQRRTAKSSS
jgi:hypothetical protein